MAGGTGLLEIIFAESKKMCENEPRLKREATGCFWCITAYLNAFSRQIVIGSEVPCMRSLINFGTYTWYTFGFLGKSVADVVKIKSSQEDTRRPQQAVNEFHRPLR